MTKSSTVEWCIRLSALDEISRKFNSVSPRLKTNVNISYKIRKTEVFFPCKIVQPISYSLGNLINIRSAVIKWTSHCEYNIFFMLNMTSDIIFFSIFWTHWSRSRLFPRAILWIMRVKNVYILVVQKKMKSIIWFFHHT